MNFLVDNQLPEALSRFLCEHGHPSFHVLNLQMDKASDLAIWSHATENDWVVVSKDDDFLHIANRPSDAGRFLWVRIGNCRTQTLLRTFGEQLDSIVRAFGESVRIVEIR